jgi:plastocyanin
VSCSLWLSWRLPLAVALLVPATLAGSSHRAEHERAVETIAAAAGSVEGQLTLPDRRATRTGERYQSSTGEARDIQDVPAVVYLAGPVAGAASARPSAALDLTQQGEAFRPTLLVVPLGATVRFPNGDPLFHNVFSYSRSKRFDLGRYPRGESKTVTFDKPGYVKVLCEVHKWMRAGVLVVENPHYAILSESGRFRFDGVPAGRYRVVAETFERRAQADVTIPEGGAAHVTLAP